MEIKCTVEDFIKLLGREPIKTKNVDVAKFKEFVQKPEVRQLLKEIMENIKHKSEGVS